MSKRLELFKKGLKSKRNEEWFFNVEKNWNGILTYKMRDIPEFTFRIEEDAKIKKDGSLEVSYIDLSIEGISNGIRTFTYGKEFVDSVISYID